MNSKLYDSHIDVIYLNVNEHTNIDIFYVISYKQSVVLQKIDYECSPPV